MTRGGFRRPFRSSVQIRDILSQKGTSYAQEIVRELRDSLKAEGPLARGGRRHLPSYAMVRVYLYLARRLGLVEYVGQEEEAHLKDGSPAPQLVPRKLIRLVAGRESDPAWSNLWQASRGLAVRAAVEESVVLIPKPTKRQPTKRRRKAPPASTGEDPAVVREELLVRLAPLIDGLPGTLSTMKADLEDARERVRPLLSTKTPEASDLFEDIVGALEICELVEAKLPSIDPQDVEDLRNVLA